MKNNVQTGPCNLLLCFWPCFEMNPHSSPTFSFQVLSSLAKKGRCHICNLLCLCLNHALSSNAGLCFSFLGAHQLPKKKRRDAKQSLSTKAGDSKADIPHRGTPCFCLAWEMLSFQTYYISLFYHLCRSSMSPEIIKVMSDQRFGNYTDIFHFSMGKKSPKKVRFFATKTLQRTNSYIRVFLQVCSLKEQILSLDFHFCFRHFF